MSDIQKSCFRGFIGFWFFCLVFCSLLPGFSAAGSIFYKSICDLWCICAVCAVLWKFNVGVEDLGIFAVKNQTYVEILEYSILHRFGFERGGCGDGRRV